MQFPAGYLMAFTQELSNCRISDYKVNALPIKNSSILKELNLKNALLG